MIWLQFHPRANPEMLGFIPSFFDEADPRPAREQIAERYAHGGGWRPIPGFTMLPGGSLLHREDPDQPVLLLFISRLGAEQLRLYEHDWLAIIQPDGSFEVSRID